MVSIKELAQKIIDDIPLHEVVNSRVELRKRGREWVGICPNPDHDDHGIGSFSVNSEKRIAKCFSCDYAFKNPIKFIAEFDGVSTREAILRISLMSGLITEGEYNRYSKEKDDKEIKKIAISHVDKQVDNELAPVQTRNLVYGIMTEGKKLEGEKSRLTQEHLEYLHTRGISDEDIEKYKYFSMPTRRAMRTILNKVSIFGSPSEIFPYIPGFYFNDEKGWFTFYPIKGIGIPIRDDEGKIVAIQIRRDEVKEGEQRYLWWSSSFASNSMGASPGSPVDVVFPKEIKYPALFITEGHFKAAVLTDTFFSPVISVQGVGNWRSIREEIDYLKAQIKYIFICYDADMAHNTAVMRQAITMSGEIKRRFPELQIYFVVWDEDLGKGIDDMILAGHAKKLKRIGFDKFGAIWCNYKAETDKLDKNDEDGRKKLFNKMFLQK